MRYTKKVKGVTLIELVMTIVIVGVLAAVSSMYIKGTVDLWRFLDFRNEVTSQGRAALFRMAREIRQIKDNLSVYTADAGRIQFIDMNNNTIDYKLTGNNLMRNSEILAGGVNSVIFVYYDRNNAAISSPLVYPNQTDIYRIKMTLTVQSGDQVKTLRSQVFLRNV